jgi:hypothetical protein
VQNSEHFIKLIQEMHLQNEDYLVSFDIGLFTSIPVPVAVEEVLQVIRNRLNIDPSFPECSPLQVEDICLTTTYFHFEDKFYQQKEGMAVGNLLSLVFSNIFMEHFKEIALDTADHKPAKWFRYVDNTFVVWPHGPARLQRFLHHLNSMYFLEPSDYYYASINRVLHFIRSVGLIKG